MPDYSSYLGKPFSQVVELTQLMLNCAIDNRCTYEVRSNVRKNLYDTVWRQFFPHIRIPIKEQLFSDINLIDE